MKIIVPDLPIQTLYDIAQCLESIASEEGIEILLWPTQKKSMIDLFDETRPDIVFMHESQLDSSFQFVCQNFSFKYILVTDKTIPTHLLQEPSALLMNQSVSDIVKASNVIPMRPVAQIPAIHNAQYNEQLSCDILINTTNIEIDANLHNLFHYVINNYNTKIIGDTQVRLHNYIGKVDMVEKADFIKSSRAIIDLNGADYWNAAYLKTPSICANVLPDQPFVQFNNEETLAHNLNNILNKDLIRSKYIDTCYQAVLNNNSSYHLAATLFQAINEPQLSQQLLHYFKGLV